MNLFIRQNKEDLLKMYPDKKESDYFLWIITDYFTRFKLNKETDNATVRIVINNNKPIDYYEGKIRTPYPNKGICQYSMKNGRKTCYGFPLKFNSLKELMNVHTINIEWEIEIENTIITTSIKYDIDISDWNNINNQILYIHHQISVLMESNAMIHTCNYFDDVYLFNPKEWVKDDADITCSEGLEFLKCTNEDMYNDYDLENPENNSSISNFFINNQMKVVMKQVCMPTNKNYYYHLCLYKKLTDNDLEQEYFV